MPLRYQKSKSLGNGARLNMSASRRGPGMSISQRVGPLTLNSRGRGSLRVAPGLSMRFGKNSGAGALIALFAVLAVFAIEIAVRVLFVVAVVGWWLLRVAVYGSVALLARIRARRNELAASETPAGLEG
jgi:hypothetical protein